MGTFPGLLRQVGFSQISDIFALSPLELWVDSVKNFVL